MADQRDETPDFLERSVSEILEDAGSVGDFENLLKEGDLARAAEAILESSYEEVDFMRKDTVDRFLDFVYFKVQTGYWDSENMLFPYKRMVDRELEARIMELLNVHLYPEIVLKLLKFFTRNVHDPDTNLYMANLLNSEEIIRSLYDTYILFKRDIYELDQEKRSLNVKRIQQFSARSESKLSSPLDAAARLKYILEFLYDKHKISHLFPRDRKSVV